MKVFFYSAQEGNYEMVEYLLEEGADPKARDRNGNTALELAAREGKVEVVRLLRERTEARDGDLNRALQLAAREGKLEVVRYLDEYGANTRSLNNTGPTPLELAAREGKTSVVRYLYEQNGKEENLDQASLLAAREGKVNTVRYLISQGANPDHSDIYGNDAIKLAAREGKTEVVSFLLSEGVSAEGSGPGCSPLFLAARERKSETVTTLIAAGASLEASCSYRDIDFHGRNKKDNSIAIYEGATPLIVALTEGSAVTARALIDGGADVNARIRKLRFTGDRRLDYRDSENLTEAAMRRDFTLNYEAEGWTPLMEAVESGRSDLVTLLLEAGADPEVTTAAGLTALQLARDAKFSAIVELLK